MDFDNMLKEILSILPVEKALKNKKMKYRLRKSLKNQMKEMASTNSKEEICKELKKQLKIKYCKVGSTKASVELSSGNGVPKETYASNGTDISEEPETTHMDSLEILVNDVECSLDTDDEAELQISKMMKNEPNETRWKPLRGYEETNKRLAMRNYFTELRSRELSKYKLESKFKSRSVVLCDSANFSNHTGFIDEVLLVSHVSMFELPPNLKQHGIKDLNHIFQLDIYSLKGEFMYGKTLVSKTESTSYDRGLAVLGYEAKILELIGKHDNIIEQIGLSFFSGDIPVLFFKSLPQYSFQEYSKSKCAHIHVGFADTFITKLGFAWDFIHDKGIIHNVLTGKSVYVNRYSGDPTITNFMFSCRIESAKCLTSALKGDIGNLDHLPTAVKNSLVPPSPDSDIYSFACILSIIQAKLENVEKESMIKLNKLIQRCFANKGTFYYLIRDWKYW